MKYPDRQTQAPAFDQHESLPGGRERWLKVEKEFVDLKCAAADCWNYGTMSHAIVGKGPWWCGKHFV